MRPPPDRPSGEAGAARPRRAGWPAVVLSGQVLELFSVVEGARAELVRCVGQWDAVQAWADDVGRLHALNARILAEVVAPRRGHAAVVATAAAKTANVGVENGQEASAARSKPAARPSQDIVHDLPDSRPGHA